MMRGPEALLTALARERSTHDDLVEQISVPVSSPARLGQDVREVGDACAPV